MSDSGYISSVLAGTFAGASGILVGHPFDTLKVRHQVGILGNGAKSSGADALKPSAYEMANTVKSTVQSSLEYTANNHIKSRMHGTVLSLGNVHMIRDLYRGLLPPLLTAGVIQSINFSLYETFKRKLKQLYLSTYLDTNPSKPLSSSVHLNIVFLSGTISGTLISFITSPISSVKVQQQLSTTKGIIACSKHMYEKYGLVSFYRGFSPFFVMESFGRGIYLYIYESTKLKLKNSSYFRVDADNNRRSTQSSMSNGETLPIRMIAAATAGCGSWLAIYPLDVIKARLQQDINREKFRSSYECAHFVYHQHGIRGFFRGLKFTMIRAAPVAATILPVYEFTKDHIDSFLTNSR